MCLAPACMKGGTNKRVWVKKRREEEKRKATVARPRCGLRVAGWVAGRLPVTLCRSGAWDGGADGPPGQSQVRAKQSMR